MSQCGAFASGNLQDRDHPLFLADEMLPGQTDDERWQSLNAHMQKLLGASKEEVVKVFGESKMVARSNPRSRHALSPTFIYGISQRYIDSRSSEGEQVCINTDANGQVTGILVQKCKGLLCAPRALHADPDTADFPQVPHQPV